MSSNTMGPIRCADEAAATVAAAAVLVAMPDAEVNVEGPVLMVMWEDEPQLSELVAAVTRPYGELGL